MKASEALKKGMETIGHICGLYYTEDKKRADTLGTICLVSGIKYTDSPNRTKELLCEQFPVLGMLINSHNGQVPLWVVLNKVDADPVLMASLTEFKYDGQDPRSLSYELIAFIESRFPDDSNIMQN